MKKYIDWFKTREGVAGILVVGSFARGEQTIDSDLDLMILSNQYQEFIKDQSWVANFGILKSSTIEDWGKSKSIRVFFESGEEVEFCFSENIWAHTNPIDSGTKKVMDDGYDIVYDPLNILKKLSEEL